jgi:hypothetical protein
LNTLLDVQSARKYKAGHRHPTGLLEHLPIPEWKWEVVMMDFIMGLPQIGKLYDSIMVVVDKLTKAAHFIPLKNYSQGNRCC